MYELLGEHQNLIRKIDQNPFGNQEEMVPPYS
jgi:hypothetical protein